MGKETPEHERVQGLLLEFPGVGRWAAKWRWHLPAPISSSQFGPVGAQPVGYGVGDGGGVGGKRPYALPSASPKPCLEAEL